MDKIKERFQYQERIKLSFILSCQYVTFKNMYLTAGQHEEEYRRQLGRYGVINDLALRPVRSLSGGQKSRVVMALMSMIRYTDSRDTS